MYKSGQTSTPAGALEPPLAGPVSSTLPHQLSHIPQVIDQQQYDSRGHGAVPLSYQPGMQVTDV